MNMNMNTSGSRADWQNSQEFQEINKHRPGSHTITELYERFFSYLHGLDGSWQDPEALATAISAFRRDHFGHIPELPLNPNDDMVKECVSKFYDLYRLSFHRSNLKAYDHTTLVRRKRQVYL